MSAFEVCVYFHQSSGVWWDFFFLYIYMCLVEGFELNQKAAFLHQTLSPESLVMCGESGVRLIVISMRN